MGCGASKYQIHADTAAHSPHKPVPPLPSASHSSSDLRPSQSRQRPVPPSGGLTLDLRTRTSSSPSHHWDLPTDAHKSHRSSSYLPPSPHPLASTHSSHPSQLDATSSSLLSIARLLAAETRLSHIVSIIVSRVPELIDCDRCTLFFVDRDTHQLIARRSGSGGRRKTFVSWVFGQMEAPALPFAEGEEELRLPMKGLAGVVALSGESLKIDDVHLDSRFDPSMDKETGYRTRSMLCVPMIDNKGECIGVIQAINKVRKALHSTHATRTAGSPHNSPLSHLPSCVLLEFVLPRVRQCGRGSAADVLRAGRLGGA